VVINVQELKIIVYLKNKRITESEGRYKLHPVKRKIRKLRS